MKHTAKTSVQLPQPLQSPGVNNSDCAKVVAATFSKHGYEGRC